MTLSFGLINLLEWITELRKTFYLLDYRLVQKDITQDSRWKRRIGRCVGRAATVSDPPGVEQPESAPHPVLSGFYGGFIID